MFLFYNKEIRLINYSTLFEARKNKIHYNLFFYLDNERKKNEQNINLYFDFTGDGN
jgi:hypothetical protein